MSTLAPLMSSAQHDWRTPRALFEVISVMAGGFRLDAAADADSRLVVPWLGPGGLDEDALATEWSNRGGHYCPNRVWLNPPYGRALAQFSAKAVEQVMKFPDMEVWLLVPARVDTRWWNLLMTRAKEVWFMAGRVKFERPDGARDSAPFPTAIVRLQHNGGSPHVHWGWRP